VAAFDFISLDDPLYVSTNFHLRDGLSWPGLKWCFQTGYGGSWMPLVWLSYMLDYHYRGFSPGEYHLTNVLLHAANSVLLFLILKRMTGAFWRSGLVAALFAWHPMHVESVAWIAERKDVLSGLFWMLAIWAYLNYVARGGAWRYLLVLALFALGLMAKPMVVTLPFVLLLLDWWPLGRIQMAAPASETPSGAAAQPSKTFRQLVLEKAPMFVLAAACCVVTVLLQNRSGAVTTLGNLSLLPRLGNAVVSYCFYIEKIFWPANLSVLYPLRRWPAGGIIAALIFLAAISDRVIGARARFPYLTVGWLWFLGTLVPVIGIMQVGAQGMADRYTYLPSIGLFIMICWGVADLLQSGGGILNNPSVKSRVPWVAGTLGLAMAILCGLAASRQLQYWRNGGALFRRAIELDPENFVAHTTYGIYLSDHGSFPEAISELRKSVQIVPEFPNGHALLGKTLYSAGQREAAATELRKALELKPDEIEAREDLGSILLDENLPIAAEGEFATALQTEPANPTAHNLMGKALAMENRLDEAGQQFAEAVGLNPGFAEAHSQLAAVLFDQHKIPEAIAHYRTALTLQSNMPEALNNLAWILATNPSAEIRNGPEAVQLARHACDLTKNARPVMVGTLAAAYAEAGDFEQALACAQKAHDLAVAQGRTQLAGKDAELMGLFRSRQAYHE
jgi:protein O-mannosyl-transferase